ncbi:MAG: hypothetical protein ACE5EK_09535, partial [Nitrospinales bacterium]
MSSEDTKTKSENKAPTHRAYSVRNFGDDNKKSYWTQIGSAWEHSDGKGYNVQLEAFPVNGRLTIRPIKEKSENNS